jgi:hypothetical protein
MVRKNRRREIGWEIKSLYLRTAIIRNGTLGKFPVEARISFLENTVLLLADALERRKQPVKRPM